MPWPPGRIRNCFWPVLWPCWPSCWWRASNGTLAAASHRPGWRTDDPQEARLSRVTAGYLGLVLGGVVLGAGLLGGCASPPPGGVQVIDRNQSAYMREPLRRGRYLVRPGDTLYSIAFRFGWDWKTLAAHNGIGPPYLLRPGDYIRFDGPLKGQATSRQTVASSSRPDIGRASCREGVVIRGGGCGVS